MLLDVERSHPNTKLRRARTGRPCLSLVGKAEKAAMDFANSTSTAKLLLNHNRDAREAVHIGNGIPNVYLKGIGPFLEAL